MVKENDGNKHDEQAMFIDSESVFPREIPDYENHLKFASEKVKTWLVREIYYRWLITYLALEKCKKKGAISFKLFWYKVFVHWIL